MYLITYTWESLNSRTGSYHNYAYALHEDPAQWLIDWLHDSIGSNEPIYHITNTEKLTQQQYQSLKGLVE